MRNGIKEIIHQLLDSAIWKFKVSLLLRKLQSCLSWNGVGNLISPWVYKGKRTSTTTSATTLFEDLPTHTCLVVILVQGEEKGLLIDDLKALS